MYQFYLGDCFTLHSYIPNQSVQLLLTDPPYAILNKTNIAFHNRKNIVLTTEFDQFESEDTYFTFMHQFIDMIQSKMAKDSYCVFFFATQYLHILDAFLKPYGFDRWVYFFFHKTNPAPKIRKNGFISSVETLVIFKRGNPTFHFLHQNQMHNFFETSLCMGNERVKDEMGEVVHETQKPINIIKHLITILTNKNDLIIDPFGGVATTLVASYELNRQCISFEKSPYYHEYGMQRFLQIKNRNKLHNQLSLSEIMKTKKNHP